MKIYIIILIIFVCIFTFLSSWITNKIWQAKQKKIVDEMNRDNKEKTEKKEEIIKDANEKKNQINNQDDVSSFNATVDILHDLSQRRE